jgi:signal transduction histidine kinase
MADSPYEEQLKAANEAVYKHSLELARLKKELEETNARQEGLIHFVSHEVKGFLTKDAGAFAAILEGDFCPVPDSLKPFVEAALAQTRAGVTSVMDILAASNIKKGTTTYTMAPFDLDALAKDVVEKAQQAATAKKLALTYTADPAGAPYTLNGDAKEIGDHVLRNLIDNALNYTPTGSISVSLKKENNKIIFAVKDTGIGISDEDKARLFTEGGHGKESQKVNVHSTGYGLFIAKNIVEAHKGTIRAESEGPGKGSTFVVELPLS